ncbi:MAG: precorrin-6A reductase [Peptococcaceae bacterium]|nr:precorrin-6A reductase [Peptococcaceae bacterium]
MKRLLLFGGTKEGRLLAEALAEKPLEVVVRTATEYGRELLPENPHIQAEAGRLSPEEMARLMEEGRFDWVVDATHPYAQQATVNIRQAADGRGLPYLRLLRREEKAAASIWLASAAEAAEKLKETVGNVLLTTGSKDLAVYTGLPEFSRRLYVRVLPMLESLESCRSLGFLPSHILAMQGPFSREFNEALLRQWQIKILVTKESGRPGGFGEKAAAAANAGAELWVIGRPRQEEGLTLEEMIAFLDRQSKQ